MVQNTRRMAMVFSHHPHEIFSTGLLLEHRPNLLFLSHAHAEKQLESQARAGLQAIGFEGTVQFLQVSERVAYARMMDGDIEWFRAMLGQVVDWLVRVRPTAVFSDAFEAYNPIHDLCPLMVDAAVKRIGTSRGFTRPERYEVPLAFGAKPGAMISESDGPGDPVIAYELTDWQIVMKHKRCEMLLREVPPDVNVSDHPATVISGMHPDLFRREFYRRVPASRDYCSLPPVGDWETYDEHGRERVKAGRFARALTFAGHYASMARLLFEQTDLSSFHDEAA